MKESKKIVEKQNLKLYIKTNPEKIDKLLDYFKIVNSTVTYKLAEQNVSAKIYDFHIKEESAYSFTKSKVKTTITTENTHNPLTAIPIQNNTENSALVIKYIFYTFA